MTKVDIFSGFLGAGKTTLIKKLIPAAYPGEKLMLIENEFGEIGIDGGFMQEAGIEINEMTSGCICCSLVGDFSAALNKAVAEYAPDRILIEPSGVGKLSDVIRAVQGAGAEGLALNSAAAVVDAVRCRMYMKNFGEFFNDQIAHAGAVILSRTAGMGEDKLAACVELIRQQNPEAPIVTTPWEQLTPAQLREAMEGGALQRELDKLMEEAACPVCGGHHEHHHHDHDCECDCHHEHHNHDHDHDCGCEHHHEHHHHHHDHGHGHDCDCGCHHDHGHHHHADEVFDSWGAETARTFTEEGIAAALKALEEGKAGRILRAKGIVAAEGQWIHFDYVPGETELRRGPAAITGRLCVIGAELDRAAIAALFGV